MGYKVEIVEGEIGEDEDIEEGEIGEDEDNEERKEIKEGR